MDFFLKSKKVSQKYFFSEIEIFVTAQNYPEMIFQKSIFFSPKSKLLTKIKTLKKLKFKKNFGPNFK